MPKKNIQKCYCIAGSKIDGAREAKSFNFGLNKLLDSKFL